jgi:hypothetical protein
MFPILLLPTHIDNSFFQWTIRVFGFIGLILLLRYFSVGRLIVTFENNKLKFVWNNKLIFKYRDIPTIDISEIKSIVLDNQGQILRKIFTVDKEIVLGHGNPNNFFKSDSQEFISFLTSEVKNLKIKDSWDVWVEKGYLIWALRINTTILILGILLVIIFIFTKGFDSRHLLMLIFIIPQLILYQTQMKTKIKKN